MLFWAAVSDSADPIPVLGLKESIDLALKRSVVVESAREGVRITQAQNAEAFTGYLPQFNTSYGYTRISPQPIVAIPPWPPLTHSVVEFPAAGQDNYTWSIEARQPIFAGGGITANYKASGFGIDAARSNQQTTVLDTIQDVKVSYFQVLKAERILVVSKQSLEQLQSHLDMAKNFFEVGLIPLNDLLQSEVELARGQQFVIQAENALELARSTFNTLLRQAVDTPVKLEDILDYKPFEISLEACQKTAVENRPEIKAYTYQLEQSKELVKVARSEYFPTISAVGHYERRGDKAGVSGNPTYDQGQENWYVGAMASWNFWEWGKTKDKVDEGRGRQNQVALAIDNIKDQITLQVRNVWLQLKEAEKVIAVARKAVEQAEENFRIVSERYKEQVATSTDVIDAQTLLTRAKSDLENALGDYNIAIARLEHAIGRDNLQQ
jgi:outer membrane protein TolC